MFVCVCVCGVCVCAFMMCKDWYVCVAQVCAYEHICIRMCLYVSVSMSLFVGIRRLGTQLLGLPAQSLKGNLTLTGDTS